MELAWTGRRVLVVEDDVIVAMPLMALMEDSGASIIGPIGSVKSALAALSDVQVIDAAVLDVNLGKEQVWPVAHALLARGVPFVFATGLIEDDHFPPPMRDIPRFGKPYSTSSVVQALYRLMELIPGMNSVNCA